MGLWDRTRGIAGVSAPAAPSARPPPAIVAIIAPTIKFRVVLVMSLPTSLMEAGTADENWHRFKIGVKTQVS